MTQVPIYLSAKTNPHLEDSSLETHGPLGTLWVGIGLMAFYLALVWVNTLLGILLTPLFIVPGTWLMDRMGRRKRETTTVAEAPPTTAHDRHAAPRRDA